MPYYAQFYVIRNDLPVEPCGSDSVIRLDGRMNRENMGMVAEDSARRRGFAAWSIFTGSILNPTKISPINYVRPQGKEDRTASSASYGA